MRLIASRFGVTSEIELRCLCLLVRNDMFNPFHLNKYLKAQLIKDLGIKSNTFVVSINRLVDKGVIARNEKSYFLNVAFRGLEDLDCIVFKVTE